MILGPALRESRRTRAVSVLLFVFVFLFGVRCWCWCWRAFLDWAAGKTAQRRSYFDSREFNSITMKRKQESMVWRVGWDRVDDCPTVPHTILKCFWQYEKHRYIHWHHHSMREEASFIFLLVLTENPAGKFFWKSPFIISKSPLQ